MKKLLTLCLALLVCTGAFAQAKNPVNWTASYKSISATEGEIIITALIDKGWHVYSQTEVKDGPIPTSFSFTPSKDFQLQGKTEEGSGHEEMDPAFGVKTITFESKAEFRQKIKLTAKPGFTVPFKVEFMCCDNSMCLPPKTIELSVKAQ